MDQPSDSIGASPFGVRAALLGTLFQWRGEWVSCAALTDAVGLPMAALEEPLTALHRLDYPIERHPQGRIRLEEPPDIWSVEEILGRCPAHLPAWEPLLLTEIGSTNDVARTEARRGRRTGLVVAAERQTKGRGRLGRVWESPAGGGLYLSLLLRPEFAAAEAGRLTILSSVAVADAVETLTGRRPQIKWPNDLMLDGRKLGGLLIEAEPHGAGLAFAVVGIGLNVRQKADGFSPEVRALATSLHLATGRLYRRADALVAILHAFARRLEQPFEETRAEWAASSLTLGQRVMLNTARGVRHGQAVGLDDSGALLLRNDHGEVEIITAGDMQVVTP